MADASRSSLVVWIHYCMCHDSNDAEVKLWGPEQLVILHVLRQISEKQLRFGNIVLCTFFIVLVTLVLGCMSFKYCKFFQRKLLLLPPQPDLCVYAVWFLPTILHVVLLSTTGNM
eukprot:2032382-Pleurochrysis_carterae.AAC.2